MHNTQDMHNSSTHNFTQYMVRMPKDSPRVPEHLGGAEVLLIPSCHPSLAPLPGATRTRNIPARGRRSPPAGRSRSAAPGAARDACCEAGMKIPYIY